MHLSNHCVRKRVKKPRGYCYVVKVQDTRCTVRVLVWILPLIFTARLVSLMSLVVNKNYILYFVLLGITASSYTNEVSVKLNRIFGEINTRITKVGQ